MNVDEIWINNLKDQIIDNDDKILFNETTGCFLANHYRASYILSWITIIESLKRKIMLFSNLGDSRATDAYKAIEKAEEQKLSTDRLIFEESKKCGIIDNVELSTINFLWEQRCLFAHPYNKQPEIDEVKHIIGQSIKLALGKELLYNKVFLIDLSDNIANKPFFLPTETEKIREFAKRTIARTPQELHPFLFKTLLFKVGEIITKPEKFNELRKLRFYLIELFINTTLPLDNPSWSLEDRVTKFPYECTFGFIHQETWNLFPVRIKEMIIAYTVGETEIGRLINIKAIIRVLIQKDVLEDRFIENYYSKLQGIDFNSAINFYGKDEAKFERIVKELESWQYEKQNPVIDYLKEEKAIDFLKSLDSEKQFYLGRLLRACATGGHWKTQYFISNIVEGTNEMPDYIKAGIAYSGFISRNDEYSLDKEFIIKAIQLFNVVDVDIQQKVYQKIFGILQGNKPNEFERMVYNEPELIQIYTWTNKSIKEWNGMNKLNSEKLIEEIKKYYS